MLDIIVQVVEFNSRIPYNSVWFWIGVYFVSLWLIISFWAARDAATRFKSRLLSIIWFSLVAVLNIPALLLYLVVRPNTQTEFIVPAGPHNINVPMQSLISGNKLIISLELQPGDQPKLTTNINESLASQLVKDLVIETPQLQTAQHINEG